MRERRKIRFQQQEKLWLIILVSLQLCSFFSFWVLSPFLWMFLVYLSVWSMFPPLTGPGSGTWEGFSLGRSVDVPASSFQYVQQRESNIFHRQVLWTLYPVATMIYRAKDNWDWCLRNKKLLYNSYMLMWIYHLNGLCWFTKLQWN